MLVNKQFTKNRYGEYNVEAVDNGDNTQTLKITTAAEKPVDKLQLRIDNGNSAKYLFYQSTANDEIMAEMLKGLDTSNVTDMSSMFEKCNYINSIDVSNFNTSNVTDMSRMFIGCGSLLSLNVSNFNTSEVKTMAYMFGGCRSVRSLDLSGFDTSKVTSMNELFHDCEGLLNIDLSNWNTSRVTEMHNIFNYCNKLTTLDLSSFDTSKVTQMFYAFYACNALTTIYGTLDLYSVTSTSNMFNYTYALTGVTLKNIRRSLQIGSGTTYGHLWELSYLINAIKELWDLSSGSQQTLTIGSANLEKIANVYVKLVEVTDEMIAADPYAASKLPCVECESTDEGAMTLETYATMKNWIIA